MSARATPPGSVAGLECLQLRAPDGARAVVSRWGAQVLSWQPAGCDERLFLSERAVLDGSAPIRGGVPLVFPQFADHGGLPAHGFARDRPWGVLRHDSAAGEAILTLRDDAALRRQWLHAFACELRVRIGGRALAIELQVRNTGEQPLAFQAALHTYLRVKDLAALRVDGLAGSQYLDRTDGERSRRQDEAALAVGGAVDRIYPGAPQPVLVRQAQRVTEVRCSGGFTDLVLWNPGAERCATLADLAPQAWRHLLCVEAARVVVPARLQPGECWRGAQQLLAL